MLKGWELQTYNTHKQDRFALSSFFMMFPQQLPLTWISAIFEPVLGSLTQLLMNCILFEGRDGVYLFLPLA